MFCTIEIRSTLEDIFVYVHVLSVPPITLHGCEFDGQVCSLLGKYEGVRRQSEPEGVGAT